MARIIEQVEGEALDQLPQIVDRNDSTSRSITRAAVNVGIDVGASAVVAFTETGRSARLVARYRPDLPLLAFTPNPRVRSQLALCWGVETFLVPEDDQHRRDGAPGRRRRCRRSAASRSASSSSSSPACPRASPARPTACASTAWAPASPSGVIPLIALLGRCGVARALR